jgi:hypothetical protein
MRLILGSVLAVLLLGAAVPPANAGIFSWMHKDKGQETEKKGVDIKKRAMPKPLDYPRVRPNAHDEHKPGKQAGRHPKGA